MPDTKEAHAKHCEEHQAKAEQYVMDRTKAYAAFESVVDAYQETKKAVINSGALKVDQDGNIRAGWYEGAEAPESQRVAPVSNVGLAARGSAVGIAGAIGAPAAAWTLVGAFGTASTGAAISGLSGAAATSATAAWFGGGAVAAGGLGMVAAPFVLTGIGAVVGISIIGVAALIASNRNRRNEKEMKDANSTMAEAERRMASNSYYLKTLEHRAKEVGNELLKATGVLEANKSQDALARVDEALTQAESLFLDLQKELPFSRLYLGRPSPVNSASQIASTPSSITLSWSDPDDGSSEIIRYKVFCRQGGRGSERILASTSERTYTHNDLTPGSTYSYKIVPFNKIEDAEGSKYIVAKTQP